MTDHEENLETLRQIRENIEKLDRLIEEMDRLKRDQSREQSGVNQTPSVE